MHVSRWGHFWLLALDDSDMCAHAGAFIRVHHYVCFPSQALLASLLHVRGIEIEAMHFLLIMQNKNRRCNHSTTATQSPLL